MNKPISDERLRELEVDAWQAEPNKDGAVLIEGRDGVFACRRNSHDGNKWWVALSIKADGMKSMLDNWELLNGCRVRQIFMG